MAREIDDTEAQDSAETTEVQVSENEPTATEEQATATEEAKPEIDYAALQKAFQTAVNAGLEKADTTTGTLPEGDVSEIKLAYHGLGKAAQKKDALQWVLDQMTEAMTASEFIKARTLNDIRNTLGQEKSQKQTIVKEPVDPTEALVNAAAAHMLAANFLVVPDGVAADWAKQVQAKTHALGESALAYKTWLQANEDKPAEERAEAPEVDAVIQLAYQLARGRGGRKASTGSSGGTKAPKAAQAAGDGVRRDIGKHIMEAFAGKPSGTRMSIAELVNFPSNEYAGTKPSPGAIAARLFKGGEPKTLPELGVRADNGDGVTTRKGAVKL